MKKINLTFKALFLLYACGIAPLILFCGILSVFGTKVIYVNGNPVVGINGFISAIFFIPLFSLIMTALSWMLLRFGYFIYGLCFKNAMHHVEPYEDDILI
ncbi:hypothetical protein [Chitinophaga sp. Cy-1792]|uniref:hypothetical protein n=1 Tax=Chitinophaga sp. Cy-1792 TaxID=2608339 RepID=UPI0014247789|nr:hypothetical protein [Chitinophaga sp. Cy-1792]NIG56488.1 hypothetical protein [Chitinophaga sp. Cy-1792]